MTGTAQLTFNAHNNMVIKLLKDDQMLISSYFLLILYSSEKIVV